MNVNKEKRYAPLFALPAGRWNFSKKNGNILKMSYEITLSPI